MSGLRRWRELCPSSSTGVGWLGFWLAVLGLSLLGREPMHRYWERVERDDAAAPLLKIAWMGAVLALAALVLSVAQLAGVVLRKDVGRGLFGLVATGGAVFLSLVAIVGRRELLFGPPPKQPITLPEIPAAHKQDSDYDR